MPRNHPILALANSTEGPEYNVLVPLTRVTLGPRTRHCHLPSMGPPVLSTGLTVTTWPQGVTKSIIVSIGCEMMLQLALPDDEGYLQKNQSNP